MSLRELIVPAKKVCDELENMMEVGGNIVDYHGCDLFPQHWFDCVVVTQVQSQLSNNIECEIFRVLLEEAKESYPEDALKSDSVDDMNENTTTLSD